MRRDWTATKTLTMSAATYSTYDIRVRAIRAVNDEQLSVAVVAQAYGTDKATVHRWLTRFRSQGEGGLERRPMSGRPRKLMRLDEKALRKIVLAPASKYGYETDLWTTRRLIQVIGSQWAQPAVR